MTKINIKLLIKQLSLCAVLIAALSTTVAAAGKASSDTSYKEDTTTVTREPGSQPTDPSVTNSNDPSVQSKKAVPEEDSRQPYYHMSRRNQ